MTKAAVVTGLGVAAPNGLGVDAYWSATLAGTSGIDRISRFDPSRFPVQVAGEVRDFDGSDHVPNRLVPQTDRWTHLGLTAAAMALADAGVDPRSFPEYEMAVVTASSSGGTEFGQREIAKLWAKGSQYVGAYQSIAWFYAATTGQISIRHGMRGPCGVICAEQAGGLDVLGQARRMLRHGTRLVVTGGTDASLCPYGVVAQYASGLVSRRTDPAEAYLPFAAGASGYVPGEGGAMLIMEEATEARARGAPRVYGQVAGYGATFDPPAPDPPPPDPPLDPPRGAGREAGLRRAAEIALTDAGCAARDVDVVFADAAGVPAADRLEAAALAAIFGPHGVPVTAPKTMTGRLLAGGAPLDVAAALLAIRDGVIPPTAGTTELAAGCDIDLVRGQPREVPVRTALVLARGHGGFNAALVVTAVS